MGFFMGFFAFMLVFTVLAIIFAKKWYGWIFYAIGTIVTYISISGNQKKYAALGMPNATKNMWISFFIIAIIGAVIVGIIFLKSKGFKMPKAKKNYYGKMNAENVGKSYKCEKCGIHLRDDQAKMLDGKAYCNSCYNTTKN